MGHTFPICLILLQKSVCVCWERGREKGKREIEEKKYSFKKQKCPYLYSLEFGAL